MQSAVADLRQQLLVLDAHTERFCDLAPVDISPAKSASSALTGTDTSSDSSSILAEIFNERPLRPFLCPLPSRDYLGTHQFDWNGPRLVWSDDATHLYKKIRSSPVLRKLWSAAAAVNNVSCWEDVSSSDLTKFWHEAILWKRQLPDIPHLCYRLTGSFEDFLASVCGVRLSVGTSGLTTPPGISFVPSTNDCVLFGATPIPLNEILDPSATSPTVFFRPEGVSDCLMISSRSPWAVSPLSVFLYYIDESHYERVGLKMGSARASSCMCFVGQTTGERHE